MSFLLSPDNAYVVMCWSGKAELWAINLADGARRRLSGTATCNRHYAWLPGSHHMLHQHGLPAEGAALLALDADTGVEETLIAKPVRDFVPSPDGRYLACQTIIDEYVMALSIQELATGKVRQLATDQIYAMEWSSDSSQLLYWVNTSDHPESLHNRSGYLMVYRVEDGAQRQITPTFAQLGEALWSPDGNWLAFVAAEQPEGADRTFLVAADGANLHSVDNTSRDIFWTAWSPTSDRLLYTILGPDPDSAARHGLWVHSLVDGTNALLAGGDVTAASWSPDGERIIFWEDFTLKSLRAQGDLPVSLAKQVADPGKSQPVQWLSPMEFLYLDTNGGIVRAKITG